MKFRMIMKCGILLVICLAGVLIKKNSYAASFGASDIEYGNKDTIKPAFRRFIKT